MSKPTTLTHATTLTRAANRLALCVCVVIALTATNAAQTGQTQPPANAPAAAQSPTPQPAATPAATPSTATDNHDLSITATVTARELLFEVVPNPKVEFPGKPRRDTVWEADRTNLPAQVQPGVTYRDIGIRLRITSVFADIERIVAEALGEIPLSDDAPPQQVEPNATPPQASNTTPQTGNAPTADNMTPTDNALTATTGDAPQANNATTTFATPAQTSRAASTKTIPARRVPRPKGRH